MCLWCENRETDCWSAFTGLIGITSYRVISNPFARNKSYKKKYSSFGMLSLVLMTDILNAAAAHIVLVSAILNPLTALAVKLTLFVDRVFAEVLRQAALVGVSLGVAVGLLSVAVAPSLGLAVAGGVGRGRRRGERAVCGLWHGWRCL